MAHKSPEPTLMEHAKYLRVAHVKKEVKLKAGNMEDAIQKGYDIFGIKTLRGMRSSVLRPRKNAMFSSIYVHDLESPNIT